jgi:hypothetical protein
MNGRRHGLSDAAEQLSWMNGRIPTTRRQQGWASPTMRWTTTQLTTIKNLKRRRHALIAARAMRRKTMAVGT